MELKNVLKNSGFSEKEAEVYQALLDLGASPVSVLAKKAKINRSTTYVVLDALTERGLIKFFERRGIKIVSPTPPESLVKYLEKTASQYSELAATARKIVPKIKIPEPTPAEESRVQIFEGREAVQTVYEDTLSSLETIRAYASVGVASSTQKNLRVQIIVPNSPAAKKQMEASKEAAQEAFKVPSGNFGFSSEINIYDSKVVFISPAEKFGLVVESKELADTLKKALKTSRELPSGLPKIENPAQGIA